MTSSWYIWFGNWSCSYFQTFQAQKYGKPVLPRQIDLTTMKRIVKALQDNEEEKELLLNWYSVDENVYPSTYVLSPISTTVPYYSEGMDTDALTKVNVHHSWWNMVSITRNTMRAVKTWSVFSKILTKTPHNSPVRATYGMASVILNSDSLAATAVCNIVINWSAL